MQVVQLKVTPEVDAISAYLRFTGAEVLLFLIKNNSNINGANIFDHNISCTVYADDSGFFLNDVDSVKKLMSCFELFSSFPGLKPNTSVCEVTRVGNLTGVKMPACDMKSTDLTKETLKILGIQFLYGTNNQNKHGYLNVLKLNKF